MAYQAYRFPSKERETGHDGGIIGELPVPVNLDELRAHEFHIVEKIGAPGVARKLDLFVGRKVFH
jgi:hypothetical protein